MTSDDLVKQIIASSEKVIELVNRINDLTEENAQLRTSLGNAADRLGGDQGTSWQIDEIFNRLVASGKEDNKLIGGNAGQTFVSPDNEIKITKSKGVREAGPARTHVPTKQEQIAWKFTREHQPSGDYTCCGAVINENWPPDVLLGIAKSAIQDGKDAGKRMDNYMGLMAGK